MKKITLPMTEEVATSLTAGELVLVSGDIFTSRDAGHKRLVEMIEKKQQLPLDLKNSTVYYVGPCPKSPSQVIGSCGPTTAGRVDTYTPTMLAQGMRGMIGKGIRSEQVVEAMKKNKAVYLCAIGGAGALYSQCVTEARLVAFEDLGAEALYVLTVKDFPAVVGIDCLGNKI